MLEQKDKLPIVSETKSANSSQTVRCDSYDEKTFLTIIDCEEKGSPCTNTFKTFFGDRFMTEFALKINDQTKKAIHQQELDRSQVEWKNERTEFAQTPSKLSDSVKPRTSN